MPLCVLQKENLPSNRVQLHKRVEPEQARICWFEDQREVLCPSSEVANYNFFYLIFFTRIIKVLFRSKYESLVKDCDPRIMSSAFEVDGFQLFRII